MKQVTTNVGEADHDEVSSIQNAAREDSEPAAWVCQYCKQTVPGSFSVCWKCQAGAA
jgi:hypothetical protein